MHGARCSRFQRNALESLQLAHRAGGAARPLVNIKLNDGVPGFFAGIGHFCRNSDFASNACLRRDLQMIEGERRITQAVAEGIERCAENVPVARLEIGRGFRTLGEVMVVIERKLSAGRGQLTGR